MEGLMIRVFNGRSLRSRVAIFLILFLFFSFGGFTLMTLSQDSMNQASVRIRSILLPAGRLMENARREIDLQIHELSLLSSFSNKNGSDLNTQQRALLRLSPSVQSLVKLHSSALFPSSLNELFQPWAQSVKEYQHRIPSFTTFEQATLALTDLRSRTHILQRAIERELSVQLLKVNEASQEYIYYWALALMLLLVASSFFAHLLWRWIEPLEKLKIYLKNSISNEQTPPPSFAGKGLYSPPSEIQDLTEGFRQYVMEFAKQHQALKQREEKQQDADRSLNTLFAAISHLLRNNEQLIAELVKKERLASMSEMAAQLAHEIKNPLNSMSLKLELLRDEVPEEQKRILDRVLDEIDRLDALTESHLSQTRGGLRGQWPILANEPGESAPLQLFEEVGELFKSQIKEKNIQLSIRSTENSNKTLQIPKSILKSALINLIKNSIEAFEEKQMSSQSPRIIELEFKRCSKEPSQWSLSIKDSGVGFPSSFSESPFEIFRTSKPDGSGLGLVTTHKMLEAYGIAMELEKHPEAPFKTQWNFKAQQQPRLQSDVILEAT
jgi:signal transduction histidine kinase